MAKVHVKKARKDYPENGVKKGDTYYFCQIKTGPRSSRTLRQLTPFKPAQLTGSEFLIRVYGLEEQIEGLNTENIRDCLEEIASEVRELGDEQNEKLQNMPEGLQQAPTGELLQARYDSCEEWAGNLENIHSSLPEEIEGEEEKEPVNDGKTYPDEQAFDDAWMDWNEKRENRESYEEDMQSAVDEAHGCGYEGE